MLFRSVGVDGSINGATVSGTFFFHSGVPNTEVAVVANSRAIDSVEHEGLWALGWVDDEVDLVESSCKQSLAL